MDCSTEAIARRCFVKRVFLEISQNSQENTCARIFFLIKLQASGLFLQSNFDGWFFAHGGEEIVILVKYESLLLMMSNYFTFSF